MHLSSLIAEYGYWAVFVGCLIEGETVLLLAGFAAHRGLLRFEHVAAVAFVASTLGDQVFFWIGRRHGDGLFQRYPRLAPLLARVRGLLARHHSALILGVRFLYGLRIAGPIAIGALQVPPLRFAWLNALGAAIWALLITALGYQFGNALQWLFDDLRRVEEWVLAALTLAVLGHAALLLWRWVKAHRA